jgi:nitrate reductase gamma subunit
MGMLLTLTTYIACLIFLGRFISHIVSWAKAEKDPETEQAAKKKMSLRTLWNIVLDIVFFRRLYATNRMLWIASLAFHISFLLVVVRHLRYFMYPVPDFLMFIQPAGLYAGYVLPISLLLMLIIRIADGKDRYVSIYNFYLLGILLLTSLTGVLMKTIFRTNLVDAKAFMLGIITFSPAALPDSMLFMVHYILVLILLPSLPFHLIASPVTTMEARRREERLNLVIHEK